MFVVSLLGKKKDAGYWDAKQAFLECFLAFFGKKVDFMSRYDIRIFLAIKVCIGDFLVRFWRFTSFVVVVHR